MTTEQGKLAGRITQAVMLVLTVSVIVSLFFPRLFPFSQEEAAQWIKSHPFDRLMFIAIQILQVLVPPISHYFTSILGGYLYGAIEGGILNYVGRVIGQVMAYFIARRLITKLSPSHTKFYGRLKALVAGDQANVRLRALIIFSMVALPFFPDDELSYLMGFTGFPPSLFLVVTIFGHVLGSFALAYLGSGQEFAGPLFISLAAATLICFGVLLVGSFKWKRSTESVSRDKS